MFNLVTVCVISLLGYIFNADLVFSAFSVRFFFVWFGVSFCLFCLFALRKEIACRIINSPC